MKEFFDWLLNATAFYIFFGGGGFGLLFVFLTILAGSVMPKRLQERYLVEPYFSKHECFAYTFWPGLTFLTWLMMYALLFPIWRGTHRNIQDLRQAAPVWFQVLLYMLSFAATVLLVSMIALAFVMGGVLLFEQ